MGHATCPHCGAKVYATDSNCLACGTALPITKSAQVAPVGARRAPRRRGLELTPAIRILLGLGVLACGIPLFVWLMLAVDPDRRYQRAVEHLAPALRDFIDIEGLTVAPSAEAYVTGKVVVVDSLRGPREGGGSVFPAPIASHDAAESPAPPEALRSHLGKDAWEEINQDEFMKLPRKLRASTPDEVGTVVWLRWGAEAEGEYMEDQFLRGPKRPERGPVPAYRITCEVTVIDKAKSTIVGTKDFRGGRPPKKIPAYDQAGWGSRPTREIVGYIKSLPRREPVGHEASR